MKWRFVLAALVVTLACAPSVSAATLTVSSGFLTGAKNVDVNGSLYDVVFLDGTCAALFDNCDDPADFPFSATGAVAASQALLDQVFIDDAVLGNFDSNPSLTFGCSGIQVCQVLTPYLLSNGIFLSAGDARNWDATGTDDAISIDTFNADLREASGKVFAKWTPADTAPVPVPEPASLTLLVLGLAAARAGRRRRRR